MADILLVAEPKQYKAHAQKSRNIKTHWLTTDQFWQNEKLAKEHDSILWQAFHTHGKYMRLIKLAHYIAVATTNSRYLGSALVVVAGDKWLLEYLMTNPAKQGQGIGSAVIDRIMREARRAKARWVVLNCNPDKNNGQLPKFYAKFGFKKF